MKFKKQNGKRRWRRIMGLEGYLREDIRWYAEYDREIRKDFHLTNKNQVWNHNVGWRQDSMHVLNHPYLFDNELSENEQEDNQ